jgi:hypothetical protein
MSAIPYRSREDVTRAVNAIVTNFEDRGCNAVVLVGSQAILASYDLPPSVPLVSFELDVFPVRLSDGKWEPLKAGTEDDISEEVWASFGEGSMFHETHDFFLDGVSSSTSTLPTDWKDRQVVREMSVYGKQAYLIAPAIEDLILSKAVAGREKDKEWIAAVMADDDVKLNKYSLKQHIKKLPIDDEKKAMVKAGIETMLQEHRPAKRKSHTLGM